MELKWLEDFISLAETRSFSRSAELRHVTQPAFSRRIQSLEAWLGNELIDRSSYPTRLTPAGEVFYEQALAMLAQVSETRALMRGQRPASACVRLPSRAGSPTAAMSRNQPQPLAQSRHACEASGVSKRASANPCP